MILITHLEEYKSNPATAEPYMTITLHDELVKEKEIVLVRGDFRPKKISKVSMKMLWFKCRGSKAGPWVVIIETHMLLPPSPLLSMHRHRQAS